MLLLEGYTYVFQILRALSKILQFLISYLKNLNASLTWKL
jgi:hypothetical protein